MRDEFSNCSEITLIKEHLSTPRKSWELTPEEREREMSLVVFFKR